jgi:hypothetical protein
MLLPCILNRFEAVVPSSHVFGQRRVRQDGEMDSGRLTHHSFHIVSILGATGTTEAMEAVTS